VIERIVVIGATGRLAVPVVRRLVNQGFHVRAMVRDPAKARATLPPDAEIMEGDLQDSAAIEGALEGMDAIYINLSSPNTPAPFDPVRDGTRAVVEAAEGGAIQRIGLLTSQGVCPEAESWWDVACKARAEEAVRASGIPFTIFRPTWFIDSLPAFVQGKKFNIPKMPGVELYWLAAADYAKQVAKAFRSEKAVNKTYVCQGPEALTFEQAGQRYIAAADPSLEIRTLPLGLLRVAGWFNSEARFLRALMLFTRDHHLGFHATETWRDLGEPRMRIEDTVAYLNEHGSAFGD
jgi:uncharacterized protein YbjT (DUF2867 family)